MVRGLSTQLVVRRRDSLMVIVREVCQVRAVVQGTAEMRGVW